MKLSNDLQKALNEQLNLELASAYAYMAMAGYFSQTPCNGFARWMQLQSTEEMEHAHKFFSYIVDRGGHVSLEAISKPKADFKSALEVFRTSLAHEQKVSAAIARIYEQALAEKDYPTLSFLKWFLDEQVEEEKTVSEMVARLELVGENVNGLFQLDSLAARRAEAK